MEENAFHIARGMSCYKDFYCFNFFAVVTLMHDISCLKLQNLKRLHTPVVSMFACVSLIFHDTLIMLEGWMPRQFCQYYMQVRFCKHGCLLQKVLKFKFARSFLMSHASM